MSAARPNTNPAAEAKRTAKGGGGLTRGESIKREQLIVRLHDIEHLTFAQIADRVGMGEKEARLAFHRHVREVAPLMNTLSNHDTVAARLRVLEEAMQQLRHLALFADNDSARVGALRELVRTVVTDLGLRRDVGLIPTAPAGLELEHQLAWMAQEIRKLLESAGAGPEASAELERILSGEEAKNQ